MVESLERHAKQGSVESAIYKIRILVVDSESVHIQYQVDQ